MPRSLASLWRRALCAALFLFCCVSPAGAALVQHWAFDETGGAEAREAVAGIHDATLSPAGARWVAQGRRGGCIELDGLATASLTLAAPLRFDRPAFTVMAWVRLARLDTWPVVISSTAPQGWEDGGVECFLREGRPNLGIWGVGNAESPAAIAAGQWRHVAWVYTANQPAVGQCTLSVYLDGVLKGTATAERLAGPRGDAHVTRIGGSRANPLLAFAGRLDDLKVFDEALGAAQIQAEADPAAVAPLVLYVAPTGNDSWTGEQASGGYPKGPLGSLQGARTRLRQLRQAGQLTRPVEVQARGGIYYESPTLLLEPQDSGTRECPITFRAYPGERPVFSGGRLLPMPLATATPGRYEVTVPLAANRAWLMRQLWVGDRRYRLARTPNEGYFLVTGTPPEPAGSYYGAPWWTAHNFSFREGDLRAWPALASGDINLVVFNLWETCTVRLSSVNEAAKTAFTETHVLNSLAPGAELSAGGLSKRYIVENAPDALDAAGEFQLDRASGRLALLAPAGDASAVPGAANPTVAPVMESAIKVQGVPASGQYVQHIRFEGLSFQHYANPPLLGGMEGGWRSTQAAVTIPAAIDVVGGRFIQFTGCEVAHTGNHAFWFRAGCFADRVERCTLRDLGGGAVYIGQTIAGDDYAPAAGELTGQVLVRNNYIHDGGVLHRAACGVLIAQASDCRVVHNDIGYFNYSGVNVGWTWSAADNAHKRNEVAWNHIHDIGQNVLSDLGGVYTLGRSAGTRVHHNRIHDVWSWMEEHAKGLYPDENSDGITFDHNLCYRMTGAAAGVNYGGALTMRNNIFALSSGKGPFNFGWGATVALERNLFYFAFGEPFAANKPEILNRGWFGACDYNLYARVGGQPLQMRRIRQDALQSFAEWQKATGLDAHSVVGDPGFADPGAGDFTMPPESPAWALGFEPIEEDRIGLEGDEAWRARPAADALARPVPRYVPFHEGLTPDSKPRSSVVAWARWQ